MTDQINQTDQTDRTETYYEIRIPATIVVRVEPDALYPEDTQTTEDALLDYIAQLIESPYQLRDDTHTTDLDYTNIDVTEYRQPPRGGLPFRPQREQQGDTRSVRVSYEKVAYGGVIGNVWQHVARFVALKT